MRIRCDAMVTAFMDGDRFALAFGGVTVSLSEAAAIWVYRALQNLLEDRPAVTE